MSGKVASNPDIRKLLHKQDLIQVGGIRKVKRLLRGFDPFMNLERGSDVAYVITSKIGTLSREPDCNFYNSYLKVVDSALEVALGVKSRLGTVVIRVF